MSITMSDVNHFPSKPEAWKKRDDEVNYPIVNTHDFQFTRRWFKTRNQTTFSTFLPKLFKPNEPVKMIQIGVFEGMDLCWDLQHILQHLDSRVLAIDPWIETTKLGSQWMEECMQRALHNLEPFKDKVEVRRGFSQEILGQLSLEPFWEWNGIRVYPGQWDFVVIDGDHNSQAVYDDAVLSFNLVRPGGILLFDDVRNCIPKQHHVAEGLAWFLEDYEKHVELLWYHRFMNCYRKK